MIFLILFLYSCAYSLVIPALPPLVRQAYPDFGVSTYYPGPYIESLSSARYVVEFLLCTYLGHLSDQSGRTGMLTLALLLNAVEFAWISVRPCAGVLGLTKYMRSSGAVISLANTVAADHALQQHSPSVRAFSLLMAATGLGFGLGPVIGAVVPPLTAYRAAAALALLAAGLTYASGEEGAEKRKKGKGKKEQKGLLTGLRLVACDPDLRDLTLAFELGNATVGIFFVYLPYMARTFHCSSLQAGCFLSAWGLANTLVLWALVAYGVVPKMVGEESAALWSLLLLSGQYVVSGWTSSLGVLYAVNLGMAFTTIYGPALQALMVKRHPDDQGAIQGAVGALRMVVYYASSQAFPHLYSYGLEHGLPPGLPFYLCALLCALGVLPLLAYRSRQAAAKAKARD